MPAPDSILKRSTENKPFAPVDTAIKIYKKTLAMAMKMPKRYTYLILKDTIELAGQIMDYAKGANSVYPTNEHELQIRIDYWIHARAKLQALSSRIDRFLEAPEVLNYKDERTHKTKGVKEHEIEEIADLILAEMNFIKTTIQSDRERFKF